MGVYWVPESREERLEVVQKMLDLDLIDDKARKTLEKIKQDLGEPKFLLDNERWILEEIIEKYGWMLD